LDIDARFKPAQNFPFYDIEWAHPRLKVNNYLHSLTIVVDDIANAKTIAKQFPQKMKLIASIHENVLFNVEQAQQKQKKIYATRRGK
jgi:hypothetical protein